MIFAIRNHGRSVLAQMRSNNRRLVHVSARLRATEMRCRIKSLPLKSHSSCTSYIEGGGFTQLRDETICHGISKEWVLLGHQYATENVTGRRWEVRQNLGELECCLVSQFWCFLTSLISDGNSEKPVFQHQLTYAAWS